jgi:integrase
LRAAIDLKVFDVRGLLFIGAIPPQRRKEEMTIKRRNRQQKGQLVFLDHDGCEGSARYYALEKRGGETVRIRRQDYLGKFRTRAALKDAFEEFMVNVRKGGPPRLPQNPALTFREASEKWLADCKTRTRQQSEEPIKQGSIRLWRGMLDNHLLPLIGEVPLSDVRSGAMREVVQSLIAKKLKPATIHSICTVAKQVVSSVTDREGNMLFPVVWNRRFIGAPRVDKRMQRTPTFTTEQVSAICKTATGNLQMAVTLLAASGLRIGELLALDARHVDGNSIRVEQSMWRGRLQTPKTQAGYRTVDLAPDVASLLARFIGNRSGFVFQGRKGRPMSERNVLDMFYKVQTKLGIAEVDQCGFHAFRRYRITHLRKSLCPESLLVFWVGHSESASVTDRYDKSCDDAEYRKDVAKSVGIGFDLPVLVTGANGRQRRSQRKAEMALTY